eukprot:CAMPEP_0119144726 /NCGR_PEP_ID=MMETSP1310-20130426/36363_1 /TAXON_ID=464262 /ORGANISM="Genus nov. species nov., Strain RCC2339" /LENGTH=581 /DNA_ID=CAMNT_0007136497 /DNA_START=110 /DNA_END=1852 /DNA_ORIENTATION=-
MSCLSSGEGEALESVFPSLASFQKKIDSIPEIVCPFKEAFASSAGRKDNAVNYWAQWQAEEINRLIRLSRPTISLEHLLKVFHAFRKVCWEDMRPESLWFPGPMTYAQVAYYSLPIEMYPHQDDYLRPDASSFFIQKEVFFPASNTPCHCTCSACATCPKSIPGDGRDAADEAGNSSMEVDQGGEGIGLNEAGRSEPPREGKKELCQECRGSIKIAMWGDIHGSVHSILRSTSRFVEENSWRLLDPTRRLVFLGDYVDRGAYSLEALYVLLRLKIANPSRVFLLRGDHELFSMNKMNHFSREVIRKYSAMEARKIMRNVAHLYSFMPVSLWVAFENESPSIKSMESAVVEGGTTLMDVCLSLESTKVETMTDSGGRSSTTISALSMSLDRELSVAGETPKPPGKRQLIQFCHGGMEMGFVPDEFLLQPRAVRFQMFSQMNRTLFLDKLSFRRIADKRGIYEKDLAYNGFMWSDFLLDQNRKEMIYNHGRGYMYSKVVTDMLLEEYAKERNHITLVFRGHQHSVDQGILFKLIRNEGVLPLWTEDVPGFESGEGGAGATTAPGVAATTGGKQEARAGKASAR